MITKCYIRVDANTTIGTGHLIRTEILADELKKHNIAVKFICNTIPENFQKKLIDKKYELHRINNTENELNQIINIIGNPENSILIIDSDKEEFYDKNFQIKIQQNGIKLMIITFYHNYRFYADIILNQNIMALSQTYSTETYTRKLLGTENVILNEDYRKISKQLYRYKTNLPNKTVLLTFGGMDKPDRTSFVYKAILNTQPKPDKVIIVLGALYQYRKKIEQLMANAAIKTELYQNTPKMPYLLAESDIVIGSGGLTVWEAAVLKNLVIIMGHSKREQIGGKFIGDNKLGIYLGTINNYTQKSLCEKLSSIFSSDYSSLVNNLSTKINADGIQNVINVIKEI